MAPTVSTTPDPQVDYDYYKHPADEKALTGLIGGLKPGDQLRVRGSLHSERGAVLGERSGATQVMLDQLTRVTPHPDNKTSVLVGAGVSLGGDPRAPMGSSPNPQRDEARSLCGQLAANNLALPLTGGITHQTISGFMSSAADGGSLTHSFWSCVQGFTLIDGTGTKHDVVRGTDLFDAASSSLGLLGVITEVKLKVEPAYDIFGLRSVQPDVGGDFDLFGDSATGAPTLVDFLRTKPYARALWWPQPGVERIELWEAERYELTTHESRANGRQVPRQSRGVPPPAVQLLLRGLFIVLKEGTASSTSLDPAGLQGEPSAIAEALKPILKLAWDELDASTKRDFKWDDFEQATSALGAAFDAMRGGPICPFPEQMIDAPRPPSRYGELSPEERMIAALLAQFVPMSPGAASPWQDTQKHVRRGAGELFKDPWQRGLPMDNPIQDSLLPVTFTELWLPLVNAPAAMHAMRDMFLKGRLAATGTFCVELYAARRNPAWLSMAHRGDVFRVDPFYFDHGDVQTRNAFFQQFWDVLRPLGACPHWGKALPPAGSYDFDTLYPRLNDFRVLRRQYDPYNLFLTDYWQKQLKL